MDLHKLQTFDVLILSRLKKLDFVKCKLGPNLLRLVELCPVIRSLSLKGDVPYEYNAIFSKIQGLQSLELNGWFGLNSTKIIALCPNLRTLSLDRDNANVAQLFAGYPDLTSLSVWYKDSPESYSSHCGTLEHISVGSNSINAPPTVWENPNLLTFKLIYVKTNDEYVINLVYHFRKLTCRKFLVQLLTLD